MGNWGWGGGAGVEDIASYYWHYQDFTEYDLNPLRPMHPDGKLLCVSGYDSYLVPVDHTGFGTAELMWTLYGNEATHPQWADPGLDAAHGYWSNPTFDNINFQLPWPLNSDWTGGYRVYNSMTNTLVYNQKTGSCIVDSSGAYSSDARSSDGFYAMGPGGEKYTGSNPFKVDGTNLQSIGSWPDFDSANGGRVISLVRWSPDGTKVLWLARYYRSGSYFGNHWHYAYEIADADGTWISEIPLYDVTHDPNGYYMGSGHWITDGDWVTVGDHEEIWVIDGSDLQMYNLDTETWAADTTVYWQNLYSYYCFMNVVSTDPLHPAVAYSGMSGSLGTMLMVGDPVYTGDGEGTPIGTWQ